MAITLNRVGVEIDGTVYQFYKLSFGFQRKLIEVQSNLSKIRHAIAKKYNIDIDEVSDSELVSEDDKLEIAKASLDLQDAVAGLFVNPEDAKILDNFGGDDVAQLIEALK